MPLTRPTRWTCTVGLVVGLAALPGCGLLTPQEAVDAAEAQWESVPAAARDALRLGERQSQAEGSVADRWAIWADSALAPGEGDGEVLGSGVVAACTAVADALAGTGVQAFGVLPLTPGLVAADGDTCARGLTLGSWRTTSRDEDVRDAQGRPLATGELQLGRAGDDDRVQLLGVALDLTSGLLETSSDTPPWTAPVTEVDAVDVDAALLDAALELPSDLTGTVEDVVVVVVPAGTTLRATVGCSAPLGGIGIESPSTTYGLTSAVTVEYGSPGEDAGQVACDGAPAVVDLVPTLRWTPAGGEPTDVVVLETARLADGPTTLVLDGG
ncbi:hypothetical protein [Modestobacter sp. Leaf380]|uniref:hypothetical protein n=1 Tax=Modestobacter sp. Leaf380 TaxID=1736356 RepID=UPI0006F5BD47|nr:hypothetical protein [Modestobacter sp. Leaf380]KQS63621.1 hypothetical protein ASG41_18410 [Modestobacter sp. Leaf380]